MDPGLLRNMSLFYLVYKVRNYKKFLFYLFLSRLQNSVASSAPFSAVSSMAELQPVQKSLLQERKLGA